MTPAPALHRPSVVIVGGAMGGIQAAKTLATAAVDTTLVNPADYYLLQPLIYEVANALLQAEDVAHSIRDMLRHLPNFCFGVAAASSVDGERRDIGAGTCYADAGKEAPWSHGRIRRRFTGRCCRGQ